MEEEPEYEVGFGKPPKEHQFPKGVSGNPLGRPKKRKSTSDLLEAALGTEVEVNGKKMSKKELLVATMLNDAIKGKPHARRMIFSLIGDDEVLEEFSAELDDKIALMKLSRRLKQQTDGEEESDDCL